MFTAKHAYYYVLRTETRRRVVDDFLQKKNESPQNFPFEHMVLGSIDDEAVLHARTEWPKYYGEGTHFGFGDSWETLYRKFYPIPAFFDLAIWRIHGPSRTLQALALGKPSDGKTHLTINWVERSFGPNYFRGGVLLPMLACAEEYARVLGCKRLLIKNPVDPSKYERYGFSPYQLRRVRAAYLCKELVP